MPCLVAREDACSVYWAGFVIILTVTLLLIWPTESLTPWTLRVIPNSSIYITYLLRFRVHLIYLSPAIST